MLRVHLLKLFLYIYPHDETIAGWIRTAVLFKCKIDWTNSKFSSDNLFFQWQLAFAGCKVISSPSSAIFFARSLGWLGPPSFLKISPGKKHEIWDNEVCTFFLWGVDSWPRLDKKNPGLRTTLSLSKFFFEKLALKKSPVQPVFLINVALRNPSATFSGEKIACKAPSLRTTLNLFFFETLILEKSPVRQFFWEKTGLENCCCRTLVRREQP